MANKEQLTILRRGVDAWNEWRDRNPGESIDLSAADLTKSNLSRSNLSEARLVGAFLYGANLSGAILDKANLSWASDSMAHYLEGYLGETNPFDGSRPDAFFSGVSFEGANLHGAILNNVFLRNANLRKSDLIAANFNGGHLNLSDFSESYLCGADFYEASLRETYFVKANLMKARLYSTNLYKARLIEANLREADLSGANLRFADLLKADLSGAFLTYASLVGTNLEGAILNGCTIYGVSTWELKTESAIQNGLIITPPDQPAITVDNLEVAQFIYLLLHNKKIRNAIDTITSKVVLILGRFSKERKAVLDAIREELRKFDYVPVLCDFEKPENRDTTETIITLARIARFIIADITDPMSIPLELQAIIPDFAVPVQPLLMKGAAEFSMFKDLGRKYHWVLPVHVYSDLDDLLLSIEEKVILPAQEKVNELKNLKCSTDNELD